MLADASHINGEQLSDAAKLSMSDFPFFNEELFISVQKLVRLSCANAVYAKTSTRIITTFDFNLSNLYKNVKG